MSERSERVEIFLLAMNTHKSSRMKKKGDHRPRTVLNTSESPSFNYAQGKTDTERETNFVFTVGFTTKVGHQTTSKIWYIFMAIQVIL